MTNTGYEYSHPLNFNSCRGFFKMKTKITIPDEIITNKIYLIRGQKEMLDRDLAELYGVETK